MERLNRFWKQNRNYRWQLNTALRLGTIAIFVFLLAPLGLLFTLQLLGDHETSHTEWAAIAVIFFILAVFTGAMANALRQRTLEYENILTYSREAMAILDEQGQFEYLNPTAIKLGGHAIEELQGRSFLTIIHPEDHVRAQEAWKNLRTGVLANEPFVIRIVQKHGTPLVLALTFAPFDAKAKRYLIIGRDITTQELERQAHERRHRELDAERAVAHAISQTLDLQSVLDLAIDQAIQVLGFEAGAIFLANDEQTALTLAVSRNIDEKTLAQVRLYRFGEGITGSAAANRQVVFVSNVLADERVRPELRAIMSIHAQVSVPLIVNERVLGVLNLSTAKSYQIASDDITLLLAIGASVAVAIDRARLFETLEERVATRTAELSTLNQIALTANQSLGLDKVLHDTLGELINTMHVRGGWISLYDSKANVLCMLAQRGLPDSITADPTPLRAGEGLSGLVVQERNAFAFNVDESNVPARERLLADGLLSMCAVPLTTHGRVSGVLGLVSHQRTRFGETELRWLGAVGNTIAVAINNAQLYETVERRATQLATLREIDRSLNSMHDLTATLNATLGVIEQIVPYDQAAVLLLDGNILHAVATRGENPEQLNNFALDISNNPIFQQMRRECGAMIIEDVKADPNWVVVNGVETRRAWLGVPLIVDDEIIGQIGLFSKTPGTFTREHSQLLMSFANHAAIAIANAKLQTELHEQARLDSLTQVLNHGTFVNELRHACDAAKQMSTPLSLIMLDLDNFKRYNDTYGHVVGDVVLRETVRAIRAHIKHTDHVGRWGGEEFCVALPNANITHATLVAERIRKTLAETKLQDRDGSPIPPPTASQGIAEMGSTSPNMDELIENADRALYATKQRGKDQITLAK